MKHAILTLALLASSSAFAKSATVISYQCGNKADQSDTLTLSLSANGNNDTVLDKAYADKPSVLGGVAGEDYPIDVNKNEILNSIDGWGDGDTDFFYAVVPLSLSPNTAPPNFTLEIIEQSDRLRSKHNANGTAFYKYECEQQ